MQIFFHLKLIVYTNYGLFTEQNMKSKVHQLWSKIKDISWAQTNSCLYEKNSCPMWSTRSNEQFYNIYGVPTVQCSVPTENLFDFQKIFSTNQYDWPAGPAFIEKHLSWQKKKIYLPYQSWRK